MSTLSDAADAGDLVRVQALVDGGADLEAMETECDGTPLGRAPS